MRASSSKIPGVVTNTITRVYIVKKNNGTAKNKNTGVAPAKKIGRVIKFQTN